MECLAWSAPILVAVDHFHSDGFHKNREKMPQMRTGHAWRKLFRGGVLPHDGVRSIREKNIYT